VRPTGLLAALTALAAAAAIWLPPLPQPLDYHDFADHRGGWGIANVFDVASNLGFLLAGVVGLAVVARGRTRFEFAAERVPWAIFFAGVLLTAAGSAWYHLAPDNQRLFWDRLPMTVAFMSLIAAQVVDRIGVRVGLVLLAPLLLLGAASAIHWQASERAGAGNVLPYAVLQAYAVVMLLGITWLRPSRYTRGSDMYGVLAAYVLAKLFEAFDHEILTLGQLVSGHTLKHVAAAAGPLLVCRMLWLRAPRAGPKRTTVPG
jgi:hypothetical protein